MTGEPARFRDRYVLQGIAAASAFLVLLGLGTWQMERLRWKEALLADLAARSQAEAVPAPHAEPTLAEYTRIHAEGRFLHDQEVLLVPRTRNGVAGAHVLTPLERPDAPALLVNRGFVPDAFAPVATRSAGNPAGPVRVEGLLRLEPEPRWFTLENRPAQGVWHTVDLAAMTEATGLDLAGYVLDADAAPNPGRWPEGGQTGIAIRNTHLEYALTWYSLAAVLAVCITIAVRNAARRRGPPPAARRA